MSLTTKLLSLIGLWIFVSLMTNVIISCADTPNGQTSSVDNVNVSAIEVDPKGKKKDCTSGPSVDVEDIHIVGSETIVENSEPFKIVCNVAFLYRDWEEKELFFARVNSLDESFKILNEQFEGGVEFSYREDVIWEDTTSLVIEQLISSGTWELEGNLSKMYEEEGYVNIMVLPSDGALNGFTFKPQPNIEEPRWNRIFLSMDALGEPTLAHEMGHFFGLSHTANKTVCHMNKCENIMSYCFCRDYFTTEQIDTIYNVMTTARDYLVR